MKISEVENYSSALQYLQSLGALPNEVGYTMKSDDGESYRVPRRITKFVLAMGKKGLALDEHELARDLGAADTAEFGELVPNDFTGPLNLKQKDYIRDNLGHLSPLAIASYVLTNPQNVRLAQRGEYSSRERTANKRWTGTAVEAPPPKIEVLRGDRPYGPLSLDEKIHVHDNEQDTKVGDLSIVYNTSTTNIINAKKGLFKRPKDKRSAQDMLESILTLVGKDLHIGGKPLDEVFNKLMRGEEL